MAEKKPKIDKAKAKAMAEYKRERERILKEIKNRGPVTIPEIAEATKLEESNVFRHVTALRQFGKVSIVGEKEGYVTYAFVKE